MSQEDWAAPWPFLSRIASMKAASRGRHGRYGNIDDLERLAALRHMRGGPFGGPPPGWTVRRRPGSTPAWRRQGGGADPARRGAAQRVPADADDRGAERRPVAPEPGLGLPDARPTRGRGTDPRGRARRDQAVRADRRRPGAGTAVRRPPGAMGRGRGGRRTLDPRDRLAGRPDRQGGVAGGAGRRRAPGAEGVRDAGRDAPGAVRDPRRGTRRRTRTRTPPRNVYERDDGRERR